MAGSEDPARRRRRCGKLCGLVVEHVELSRGRAAEAVDHQRHPVTRSEGQVVRHRIEQDLGDLVRALDLGTLAPRLAMDADADFHFIVANVEDRRALGGRNAAGERDAHRADIGVHLLRHGLHLRQALAFLGGGTAGLHHEEIARHAAAADGVER
ncbi:hypothetical protein KSW81_002818, partial [Nannochloris sp. 'desiccata']